MYLGEETFLQFMFYNTCVKLSLKIVKIASLACFFLVNKVQQAYFLGNVPGNRNLLFPPAKLTIALTFLKKSPSVAL
jgi:hypothetical protein